VVQDAGTPAARGQLTAAQPQAGADNRQPEGQDEISEGERRLLAATPLHAITALHGEAGLRERFAMEIGSLPDGDQLRAERALELAARLHAGDRRQREPYVNHLLRVAIRIITYYGVRDADVICAALLHDAVEDHADELTDGGGQQEALAALASQFGNRVAELVAAVTNPPHELGRDRHEEYREHVAASLEANPWARVIKASDFTDNGVGLIHTTGPQLDRLASKYAPLVPILAELISRSDTPLSDEAKDRILGQLDRARQRFAAIKPTADPTVTPGVDSVREDAARERWRDVRSQAKLADSTSSSAPWGHEAMPSS
jgi:hypothetical protein